MADRTVTANLVAKTTGYNPAIEASAKVTTGLASAQKDAAASTKAVGDAQAATSASAVETARTTRLLTTAQRDAAAAARDAAAADAVATKALTEAQKEVTAAAKDTSALSAERQAAAQVALESAEKEAAAAAEVKAAATAQARASTDALAAYKTKTAVAKEDSAEEAANAKATEDAAKKRSDAYTATGKTMLVAGALLTGAFVEAEKATSDFNKSLSTVQAVSDASAADMDKLRGAALQAGKDTAYTATEAANAEGELVKAGVSVSDVLGGALQGALSLAAAGQLGLADAATISANAMNTFGLKGQDVSHIADVYAAAANKSAADVQQLAYAMQQGGLVASQTGLTFEDTTAVLAAFADRGLEGADAGTSMKTMLEKLNAPTTQARSLMEQLGIVTYDASGKFVGITQFAGELHDKLGALTDAQRNAALSTIFGSDAIRGASVLYNLGADGVKGYSQAVNDQGAASRVAAEQMNNLSGDLHQLRGSIDVALIQGGSGANNVLRDMTQHITALVNAFASLPKPVQEAAVGFAGGGGAALLMVGGLSSLAGKAASTKKTLGEVAEASKGLKGALASAGEFMAGPWGIAIAGAATAITLLATSHQKAEVQVASFTDALKQDSDSIGAATTAAVSADPQIAGVAATFGKLGISAGTVTDAVLGSADAMSQITAATDAAIKATNTHTIAGQVYQAWLTSSVSTIKDYHSGLVDQLKTQQQVTAATQSSSAATGTSAAETARATQAAKDAAASGLANAAGQRALTDAERAGATATAAATGTRTAGTAASHKLTAALREQVLASDDGGRAEKAAAVAADKHTDSLYKAAASAKAAADAAAKNKDANATEAKATADAAEAAAEASDVHKTGVKWLLAVADAEASASGSARDLDSSVTDEVGAMNDAKKAASTLKDAMDALNGVHISASRAAVDVQQKIADLTKSLHENGTTLDITTAAGRANVLAIDDMASAASAHAQAVAEESGSIDAGNKALDASRDQFDAVLKQAGLTTTQIDAFNKSLLNTPKLAPIQVTADTSAAERALSDLATKWDSQGIHIGGGHALPTGYATGGLIDGVGTGTSDSNMIAASKGEYMVKASVVARPGVLESLNALNFGGGSATVVKPTLPFYGLGVDAAGHGGRPQSADRAPMPAATGISGPLAVFNYTGTQAPTPEQQAIMMRRLAQAVNG